MMLRQQNPNRNRTCGIASSRSKSSNTDLILVALFGLWMPAFGIGFFVLKQVNERLRAPDPWRTWRQSEQLDWARALASIDIVLCVATWLGIVILGFMHPVKPVKGVNDHIVVNFDKVGVFHKLRQVGTIDLD